MSTVTADAQPRTGQRSIGYWAKRIRSNYLVRKVFKAVFTIWFVTSLIFFLVRLMPSNPVEVFINELITQYSLSYDEARDQATALFVFDVDQPLIQQYTEYVGQLLRGNLGTSLRSPGTPVLDIIKAYLPWTIFSVGIGLLLSFTLGVFLGMIMAYKRDAWWEAILSGLDTDAQKALVQQTAQAFNELLPIVPLWERYGNNPAMDGLHTCGWLPDDDPIYKNSPYADSFVVIMVMEGTLYPCNQ